MKILFTSTKRNPETLQTTRQTYQRNQGNALIIGGSYMYRANILSPVPSFENRLRIEVTFQIR
jgi:hypothetical protein